MTSRVPLLRRLLLMYSGHIHVSQLQKREAPARDQTHMYCFCAYAFEPAISSDFWKNADNGFLILDMLDGIRVQKLTF